MSNNGKRGGFRARSSRQNDSHPRVTGEAHEEAGHTHNPGGRVSGEPGRRDRKSARGTGGHGHPHGRAQHGPRRERPSTKPQRGRRGEGAHEEIRAEQKEESVDGEQIFTERTPRVVNAAKLKRTAARRKAQRFLVEGENCVEAAVATGAATDIFVTKSAAARFADILEAGQAMGTFIHLIDAKAARSLQDTVTSTGIFAVCRDVLWSAREVMKGRPTLMCVPVETNEPGNAGTLIRVADAMGADAVLFAGDTVDPQSGKAARSSAGSLFHIPVARERNIMKVLSMLRAEGLAIVATAADGEVDLTEAEELLAQPTAWLFGNEAHGLPEELQQAADVRVRIPIRGRAESLNLATAASICLFESSKYQVKATESEGHPDDGEPGTGESTPADLTAESGAGAGTDGEDRPETTDED